MNSLYSINEGIKASVLQDKTYLPDAKVCDRWLSRYYDSKKTYESYRKEVNRFLLWTVSNEILLNKLTHEHLIAYLDTLKNPDDSLISKSKRSISDIEWKPFSKPLSESSIQLAKRIVNLLLDWLVAADYIRKNPMALIKKRAKSKGNLKLERFLTDDQMSFILSHIGSREERNGRDHELKARDRWIVCALYYSMLRISEFSNAMNTDVRVDTVEGKKQYWLRVIGKGGRIDEIPMPDKMMDEYQRYLLSVNLKPTGEYPLIMRSGSHDKSQKMTRSGVHLAFKKILTGAANKMELDGMPFDARTLRSASAHWIRHTAGSSLARNGANIVDVRDSMRHSDISTTSIYMHGDKMKLHNVINAIHHIPENKKAD